MRRVVLLVPVLLLSTQLMAKTEDSDASLSAGAQPRHNGTLELPRNPTGLDDQILLAQDATSGYEIKFEYSDSEYSQFEIANYGEAFRDGVLVGMAEVTGVEEISNSQARVRVEVTHFAEDGEVSYQGVVYFRKGLPGTVISETALSGSREQRIFTTWPTW